jgi:hypothetical protein
LQNCRRLQPALQRFLQPAATRYDHLQTEAFAVKHACCDVFSVLLDRRGLVVIRSERFSSVFPRVFWKPFAADIG